MMLTYCKVSRANDQNSVDAISFKSLSRFWAVANN